jgi:aminoglycoside/choline kinase family phosphotransferase
MSEPSEELVNWVENVLREQLAAGFPAGGWYRLSGDAGFRQYFRLPSQPPMLAVVAPPETEKNAAFVAIADYLRKCGIRTPKVIAYEPGRGFMLVEDLGPDLLQDHLVADTADLLYGEALTTLLRLQQLKPESGLFPTYTRELLVSEAERFDQWFVQGLLGHELFTDESQLLAELYDRLAESALEQPQVVTHRDFHSRNLVHNPGTALGVIDFQDAVTGPLTYDLVSLLRDCYIKWPEDQVQRWALAYASMATDAGLLHDGSREQFLRWFDWMGMQRHIKVLGVFARLSLRDGKHGYLRDLPRVVAYVREIADRYVELEGFAAWFGQRIMPLVNDTDWYKAHSATGAKPQ